MRRAGSFRLRTAIFCSSAWIIRGVYEDHSTTAFKNLKALALPSASPNTAAAPAPPASSGKIKALGIPDCCICLFSVTIRQALFIAPCSHTFHYKCIRPILEAHHPSFTCPLCRTYADLDEDVEVDEGSWEVDISGAENENTSGNENLEGKKKIANEAVENVLNAVGAVSGATGRHGLGVPGGSGGPVVSDVGEEDEEGDEPDRMDIDQDGRDGTGALTPNDQIAVSGEEDDSDNVHIRQSQAINTTGSNNSNLSNNANNNNNNSNNPFASNASLGVAGAAWGSPGAGSSTSARGDSPIPGLSIGGGQAVAVGGGDEEIGGGVVGEGIEGDTVSGKRKR
ncbi:hypothetical protein NP233_g1129 [Leucocoprinus birnbaumii]|uniref:RING-type domain-containing protein n=1 Tax=Leucocoprinus birnbaumii TaxID=56174 RepID=A0AAD5W132_9AGAR|nr:hypothetical protein NP233_g1129 [Leucocoprinus birnbaumii]